ncbi:MAG: hypothetical protein V1664_01180 [Candidatus Uhrbacteria bacterium]
MKKIIPALIFLTLLVGFGCGKPATNETSNSLAEKFAVYLTETDQMIFSEDDLTSYEAATGIFTFTEDGAKKMQAYQTTQYIDTGLYQKSFVAKLGDEKMYQGKFWTGLSSMGLIDDIIISDVVMIGPDFNTLTISVGYPNGLVPADSEKQINNPQLIEHFKEIGKLK